MTELYMTSDMIWNLNCLQKKIGDLQRQNFLLWYHIQVSPHSLDYFQMVKAGLILGLFGGSQKFVNDKVEILTICLYILNSSI